MKKKNVSILIVSFLVAAITFVPLVFADEPYVQEARKANDAHARGDYASAEEQYKEMIALYPQVKELYYNLAVAQYEQRKYEESARNLYKAIDMGFAVPPQIEEVFRPYKYREFTIDFGGGYVFKFQGSTNCTEQLILDVLPGAAGLAGVTGESSEPILVETKFVQWGEGEMGLYWEEEWKIKDSVLRVVLTPDPHKGGHNYTVSRKHKEPENI